MTTRAPKDWDRFVTGDPWKPTQEEVKLEQARWDAFVQVGERVDAALASDDPVANLRGYLDVPPPAAPDVAHCQLHFATLVALRTRVHNAVASVVPIESIRLLGESLRAEARGQSEAFARRLKGGAT